MASQDSLARWRARVDGDIDILKQAQVRPLALVLRLENAKFGTINKDAWPAFQLPGRGISNYHEDGGAPTVVLEFRHRADAKTTEAQLNALLKRLKAIKTIEYREFGPNDGASLNICLKPRPKVQPVGAAKK